MALAPSLLKLQPPHFPQSAGRVAFLPAPTCSLAWRQWSGFFGLSPPVVCFPKPSPCLGWEVSSPGSKPEPGLSAQPPVPLALIPGSSDRSFCFLIAVSTGLQNRSARKTSTADNSEPGTVRSLGARGESWHRAGLAPKVQCVSGAVETGLCFCPPHD